MSVSCPSANEFMAISLLHLAQSSSNLPQSFEGFRQTLRQTFNWILQQMKNFHIDPHCKNRPLSAMLLRWGYVEKFFNCCPILMKFSLRVRLKPSNDGGEFETD